jgi:hypothetical protein
LLDGLSLARRIQASALPTFPIIMPISAMGRAAFDLMLSREDQALRDFIEQRVLPINDAELDDPELPSLVAAFVRHQQLSPW